MAQHAFNPDGGRFPTGIEQINQGKCGMKAPAPVACMFCQYGHMMECHYPQSCVEARCSHFERAIASES